MSFNEAGIDLQLRNLNVLIGPNGCGKSNFIEAISLFQSAPSYLASPVKVNGGISAWLHKGINNPTARLEIVTNITSKNDGKFIKHSISFCEVGHKFVSGKTPPIF